MSYVAGAVTSPYTSVGTGTLQTNAGSTTVSVSANTGTVAGDLIVLVVYTAADITIARDAGEGWICLDCGFDSANSFGVGMFACVSTRAGATRNGLTLATSAAWTAQSHTYRVLRPGIFFNLASAVRSAGWFNASGSATALTRPAFAGAGRATDSMMAGIELTGGGYNNGGTTTTVGNITSYTERFDTGQTSPAHGVVLNDRTTLTAGTTGQYGTLSSTLAVAKTNRGAVRAFIPIDSMISHRNRWMSSRRVG